MERSLRINILAGFWGMFWMSVPLGAPLPLLMQTIDASGTQLGILSASWQIAMLAQIPAAFWAERLRRRKVYWASTTIAHRILWAAPAVVPAIFPNARPQWPMWIIACLSLSSLLANLGTACWQSWMADLVPEQTAGSFWGIRQRFLALGLMVATATYGWILDHPAHSGTLAGFQWVFALCSFFGVCDIVIHLWVREPAHVRARSGTPFFSRIQTPFRSQGFRSLTASMALWTGAQSMLGYTLGMPGFFSMVHLKETFGASFSQASLIFLCNALGAVICMPWIGRWMDRAGAHAVLLRLMAAAPLAQMGWWLAPHGDLSIAGSRWPLSVFWMVPVSLVQGAILTGALLCQFRLTQMATLPEGRTLAMALHWSISGIGGALGAVGAGMLHDAWKFTTSAHGGVAGAWTGFDALVFAQALLVWCGARPILRKFPGPALAPS
jgi:hypothetical protein